MFPKARNAHTAFVVSIVTIYLLYFTVFNTLFVPLQHNDEMYIFGGSSPTEGPMNDLFAFNFKGVYK